MGHYCDEVSLAALEAISTVEENSVFGRRVFLESLDEAHSMTVFFDKVKDFPFRFVLPSGRAVDGVAFPDRSIPEVALAVSHGAVPPVYMKEDSRYFPLSSFSMNDRNAFMGLSLDYLSRSLGAEVPGLFGCGPDGKLTDCSRLECEVLMKMYGFSSLKKESFDEVREDAHGGEAFSVRIEANRSLDFGMPLSLPSGKVLTGVRFVDYVDCTNEYVKLAAPGEGGVTHLPWEMLPDGDRLSLLVHCAGLVDEYSLRESARRRYNCFSRAEKAVKVQKKKH